MFSKRLAGTYLVEILIYDKILSYNAASLLDKAAQEARMLLQIGGSLDPPRICGKHLISSW